MDRQREVVLAVVQGSVHQGSAFFETGDGETGRKAVKLSRSDWKATGGQAARSKVLEHLFGIKDLMGQGKCLLLCGK